VALARRLLRTATVALVLITPAHARAQAFTPPEGVGSVTLAWQFVENTGHIFTDGFYLARGPSVTTSLLFDIDYGVTDRLAVNGGIPYIFARYTGDLPAMSGQPHDECRCWNSSFQDFSVAARYRFGNRSWAVTPLVRYSHPSHNYGFRGEAVVGRNLRELQVGLSSAVRLPGLLSKGSVAGTYIYSFVEKPISDTSMNRTNGFLDFGYAVNRRLYVRGSGNWQRTHGGLRVGSPTGNPFFPPGELGAGPERAQQRDRLQRSHYWQAGGGASYSLGSIDVFASIMKYVWGRDSHNGRVYSAGVSWYFDLSQ
jgi:hypothetical protein